ncbi:hypothetical protein EMEDMD4_10125 [Sinorhizobium medicae]|uniref:Uncharacterized protein n=1 Tax=Sinorhizobium medicae TaxID=110321 RepID=A0A508WTG2_9HYPH|nr:hypothetical protein EMEDMD4_10125 [Sinorhizobium medicae]
MLAADERLGSVAELQERLAAAEVAYESAHFVHSILRYLDRKHRTRVGEGLCGSRHPARRKPRPDQREIGEVAGNLGALSFHEFNLLRGPQAKRRSAAIGTNQSAAAKQDAPEPARDDDGHPVQRLAVYRRKDRLARRAARFAVVTEAIVLADPPGPAIVIGRRVGVGGKESFGGLLVLNRPGDRQEAALPDFLCRGLDALKGEHPLFSVCDLIADLQPRGQERCSRPALTRSP